MPKVTPETTIDFIKMHMNYDGTQEQKLSKEDTKVQELIKAIKPGTKESITKLAEDLAKEMGKEIKEEKLSKIMIEILKEFKNQLLEKNSLTPIALFGIGGGLFGRWVTGGPIGVLLGVLSGIFIGALCAEKPDPIVTIFAVELGKELSKHYPPEMKEMIARTMGNALYDRCHLWADIYGGWAQGVHMTLEFKSLENGAKYLLTPSFLRDQSRLVV